VAKKILVVAIIVFVGVLLGVAGYLAKNKPVKTSQPQVSTVTEPTKSVEDETADLPSKALATEDWKTYRNEKYEFEVKYPISWQNDANNSASVGIDTRIRIFNLPVWSSFEIMKNNNDRKLTLDEWVRELIIIAKGELSAEVITINGFKAYKLKSELEPSNTLFYVVITDKNNKIFTLYAYSGDADDNKTLEQILSTFKFIN